MRIFLQIPGLLNEIKLYENKINQLFYEKGIYSDFIHGRLWQNYYLPKFEGRYVLTMFVFFDDFDCGNALGSHAGGQEFGSVYVSLPTLPPHLRAKLKNILLATIFHSEDRKLRKNEVFHKTVDELNNFSSQGLSLQIDEENIVVYIQCVGILGNNLGLNQIFGFSESFTAEFFCRRCRLNNYSCKCKPFECLEALRTKANYEKDLENSECGIKSPSIFNDINNLHIITNPSLDIMHDLFEGLGIYTVESVLSVLILVNQKITLETVNQCIEKFKLRFFGIR